MDLKKWLHKLNLFIDLDNTLIDKDNGPVCPRPHLKHFIEKISKIAHVTVLTHGLTEPQTKVAKIAEIPWKVIGRDKYYNVKNIKNAILIDNLPADHENTKAKLAALKSKKLIKVKSWHCGNKDDQELIKLLKIITDK